MMAKTRTCAPTTAGVSSSLLARTQVKSSKTNSAQPNMRLVNHIVPPSFVVAAVPIGGGMGGGGGLFNGQKPEMCLTRQGVYLVTSISSKDDFILLQEMHSFVPFSSNARRTTISSSRNVLHQTELCLMFAPLIFVYSSVTPYKSKMCFKR